MGVSGAAPLAGAVRRPAGVCARQEPARPIALERAALARSALRACRLCALRCGVDRMAGPAGRCRAGASPRVFHEGIEWVGESSIVPTYVVSFSGCNMACRFCLTGESSQNAAAGDPVDADGILERILGADPSVRSVTILGGEPTIHLPAFLDLAARIPRALDLVLKTNAYLSEEGRRLLDGIPDVVLADYKFGNDGCARRLAGVPDYTRVVQENLSWAARAGRIVVRHLLMPGHFECCFVPVADWVRSNVPEAGLSLLTDFLPVFRSDSVSGLGRFNRPAEIDQARAWAADHGVRLVPFTWAPGGRDPLPRIDEVWIDPSGRICFDSASSSLVSLLETLKPGL